MMGKIAKLFLICTLLLVGESFADLPYALKFSCSKSTDDVYTCDIEQLQSSKPTANTYTTWGSFLQAFQTEIESKLDISKNPSAKTDYSGFVIRFNSNIDFGGYQKTGDVITCRDATFAPMNFGPLAFQPTIDGNGKTIKNFCYITEDVNAAFFSNLSSTTVKNITFSDAYVKAKTVSGAHLCGGACNASVVANTVQNVNFENVVVRGAVVYGWQTSTLAITAGTGNTDKNTPAVSLKKIKIDHVTLGMTPDVIAEHPMLDLIESAPSASGGIIADVGGHVSMEDSIKVLNLSVPDSISKIYKDVSGTEYIGNRYVGGIAGRFTPSAEDTDFTLDSIEVSADLSGLWVGGLFGRVSIDNDNLLGSSNFNVTNAKVTLNSPVYLGNTGDNRNRYFGGLVGEWIWLRGKVVLSNDTVDVSADWRGDKDFAGTAYMGGLAGFITGKEDGVSLVDVLAENNTVTAEMLTSSRNVYAGGILGRVNLEKDDIIGSGSLRILKSNVKAKKSNLITTTAKECILVNASYLVGNAVTRGGNINILQNHAEGNIYIANDLLTAPGGVGAEVGLTWSYGAKIYNNTSVGDLLVKKAVGAAGSKICRGYVAGKLQGNNSESKINVRNNFHYGSIDMGTYLAVGVVEVDNKEIPVSTWNKTYSSSVDVRYNYRNALKGDSALAADGSLKKDGSGDIIVDAETGAFWYNGVIDADVMKSRLFTYVMNATQPSGSTVTWESEPSSLPVISSKERTAYKLAISLTDADYKELKDEDKVALKDYLPAKCEAGKCSLYVYTEKDKMLKSGLNSEFLNAGLMIVDDDGSAYAFSQKFSKDDKAKGLTDREIKVTYYLENPAQLSGGTPMPVSMDDYVDDVTFAWPKVEKVRLLSSKDIVPTALLDYNNAKYELVLYQAYTCPAGAAFFAGCKNVFASGISLAQKQMNNIEAVLKEVRTHINNNNGDEIQLYYKLVDLSEGISYMPQLDIGLFNSKAKINVTTYGYNKNDALDEIDSYELGITQPLRSDVDMASKYGFNLAERGFKLDSLIVDFWLGLNETSTDVIKECYNEGSKTAKCAETNMYGDLSKNYFNSESDIENQLNAMVTSGKSRLMKWSTKLDADEMLNLDSMAQAMSIVVPQMAAKAPMFMAVEPHLTGIPYKVAFDINAGGKNVFLTDEFAIKDSYSRENDETAKLPEGLLATDACFVGWIENAENPALTPSIKMDGTLLEKANPKDRESFDLYGAWDAGCTVEKAEVLLKVVDKTGAEGDYGTVTLNQSYRNPGKEKVILKHDFVDGRLEVPTSAEPITLHVTSTQTNKDYDLAQLTLKAPNGNDMPISLTPGDTSFKLEPRVGESYTLYAVYAGYIDISVNADRSDVMYGNASDVKTVRLVESGTTFLPKWVYTPTECVLGWSVKSGEVFGRDAISSDELIAKVGNDKELHAVWHGADACVANADYRRLKLETEHGTVEIIEVNTVDGSEIKHAFADDSTMLLPRDYARSSWVVRGVPQKGYKLDSVVIEGRIKLADGDVLTDSITGYLPMKAYFSEYREPVVSLNGVVSLTPRQVVLSGTRNGNAMRLPIEWHVEQGAVAELRATLLDALGVEVKPLVDSVAGNGSLNWDVFPLLPGVYRVNVKMKSGSVDSVSYVTEAFTVLPEIAVAPNTWRMVSLSDVDESAIVWDGDPAFYYWDESAEYGVVWKYQRYNGGAVKAQQGIWYNSLEGRSLVLRMDAVTGSNVAQGAHEIVWELEKGWNMVANPYGWKVKLPENILNTFEICKWSAESGFAPVTELEPYEAVWLLSDTKTPIGFAAEPSFDNPVNVAALQKATLAKATREKWTLQAELRDTRGHGDSWNVLGVGAAEERLEPPAGMGDFVNLSVVEGKKALLKSIKSAEDDRHEWNFALSATTDRVGYLKFEGVKALNEMGLKVYVTIDGKTTEMGAGDSLKVLLKAAGSTATVQVTSSAVTTVASKIENLRFERVPGALQVGFDVSSDLAGAGYRVQLVSVNGKVAATYSGKSTAGHNTLALTAPKPGLYLLRVTLGRHHAVRKVAISR